MRTIWKWEVHVQWTTWAFGYVWIPGWRRTICIGPLGIAHVRYDTNAY